MAACYGLGESELIAGMGVARNSGVVTPFYRAREGEERVERRQSSGSRCLFDGLQWGNALAPRCRTEGRGIRGGVAGSQSRGSAGRCGLIGHRRAARWRQQPKAVAMLPAGGGRW
jgi:hypothetical protein